jgi:tetratricopeptide (TPR) repeat protein
LPLAATAEGNPPAAPSDYRQQAEADIQQFHWDEALQVYRNELADHPDNAEAWLGIGRILRWQGHLEESREAYEKAAALAPQSTSAALGIADAYRLEHDYAQARASYEAAAQKWPDNEDVRQETDTFRRETHPRLFLSYDKDLTSRERDAGIAVPFLSREEFRFERGEEDRNDASYRRNDEKVDFAHYFGLDHFVELRLRRSQYSYPGEVSDFTAIDKFDEFRLRYFHPLTPAQVLSTSYTHRLNTLQTSRQKYTSSKLEVELHSQWTPRFATLVGGGALRDLSGDATSTKDFRTTSLAKAGVELALTQKAQATATFITNPDLDNSISSKTLLQFSYQWSDAFSTLARYRFDKYKDGINQQVYFVGVRYSPGARLWSELGVQVARRGDRRGSYPLASLVYRF